MPYSPNWVTDLQQNLPAYLNGQDAVVHTLLEAFASQWQTVYGSWQDAEAVWSILGASGNTLTRIASYMNVQRLPGESDAHLLQRMGASFRLTPTQAGLEADLNLLNEGGSRTAVYYPFGGIVQQWDASASFRFHRVPLPGTFTRDSSAWDPFTGGILPANTPTFQPVQAIPNEPSAQQTGLGVWQASTNLWPHSEWTVTTLQPTLQPSLTDLAYWTILSGTAPQAYTGLAWQPYQNQWYVEQPVQMVTGPSYSPPLSWSGTYTGSGVGGYTVGPYVVGVSGTEFFIGSGTQPTILTSGTMGGLPAMISIAWTASTLTGSWFSGTQSGTLSVSNPATTAGPVGIQQWSGSGTYQPGTVSTSLPATLTPTLTPGPSLQWVTGSSIGMPGPGDGLVWRDPVGSGTVSIQYPSGFSVTQSGTWSWWGKTGYTVGTGQAVAGSYTLPWTSSTWAVQSLTVPAGSYTPTWTWSGTQGIAWWGMPQWEALGYSTPYIPNPGSGTTSRAQEFATIPNIPHPQTQGMLGLGVYITDAWNAGSGTLWSYQSGTQTMTVDWTNGTWTTTWNGIPATQTVTLAPNQWHYGLWTWAPWGWSVSWDGQSQSGTQAIVWQSGTYTATFGANAYYTNVLVNDAVLPASQSAGWSATILSPLYCSTAYQGLYRNSNFSGTTGQMADGWAYTVGITLPPNTPSTAGTFILDQSALNQNALGTTSSPVTSQVTLEATTQQLIEAGAWIFPWAPGYRT